jgi:hypothetical protein
VREKKKKKEREKRDRKKERTKGREKEKRKERKKEKKERIHKSTNTLNQTISLWDRSPDQRVTKQGSQPRHHKVCCFGIRQNDMRYEKCKPENSHSWDVTLCGCIFPDVSKQSYVLHIRTLTILSNETQSQTWSSSRNQQNPKQIIKTICISTRLRQAVSVVAVFRKAELLRSEDECNVRNLPSDTGSHPIRHESSATPLWEPRIWPI